MGPFFGPGDDFDLGKVLATRLELVRVDIAFRCIQSEAPRSGATYHEVSRGRASAANGNVRFAAGQIDQIHLGNEFERYSRVQPAKSRQVWGYQVGRDVVGSGDANLARCAQVATQRLAFDRKHGFFGFFGFETDRLAAFRQCVARLFSIKEAGAQSAFQGIDTASDRGGAGIERPARGDQAPGPRDGQEVANVIPFHSDAIAMLQNWRATLR